MHAVYLKLKKKGITAGRVSSTRKGLIVMSHLSVELSLFLSVYLPVSSSRIHPLSSHLSVYATDFASQPPPAAEHKICVYACVQISLFLLSAHVHVFIFFLFKAACIFVVETFLCPNLRVCACTCLCVFLSKIHLSNLSCTKKATWGTC